MNKWVERVLVLVGSAIFAVLFLVLMIEWLAGCGETWVQADGSRVVGECVFIGDKK